MSDPRFARLHSDPRFRKPKKKTAKVVVDERFKSILEDSGKGNKSKSAAKRVDKYGRKVSDAQEKGNLKRFYRLDGDEEPESGPSKLDFARGEVLLESSEEEEDDNEEEAASGDSENEDVHLHRHTSKLQLLQDLEELEVDLNEDDDALAELNAQVDAYNRDNPEDDQDPGDGSRTNRIAVVNLDWDYVRASHLYKIFSSLVTPTASSSSSNNTIRGKVINVRVYPSEFGKARMKREEVEGPPKELFQSKKGKSRDGLAVQEDDEKGYNEDALRKHQLERLRYYYAVVTCDSTETAAHIFKELDGTELERSANVFDLSFVPDDMTFEEEFRDEATSSADLDGPSFKGLDFSTDALRHSKVRLRWDEDDAEREKVTRRALTRQEIDEGNFKALIASSSESDSGSEGEAPPKGNRERLRNLLLNNDDDQIPEGWDGNEADEAGEGNIEITFRPALSGAANAEEETTLEKYKRKQREKRKKRKEGKESEGKEKEKANVEKDDFFGEDGDSDEENVERREATREELELVAAPDHDTAKHFDMNSIIKEDKRKSKKGKKGRKAAKEGQDDAKEDFQVDVADSRFKAIHEDPSFAIDPSNPHFKKTKGMAAILEERSKRQKLRHERDESGPQTKVVNRDLEPSNNLQKLVESVKRKSTQHDGKKGSGKRKRT